MLPKSFRAEKSKIQLIFLMTLRLMT